MTNHKIWPGPECLEQRRAPRRDAPPDRTHESHTMTIITINGHIDAIGDIDYAEGGTVRGVLIKMHADDVRQIAAGRLLFTDVRVTFERREPGDEPTKSSTPSGVEGGSPAGPVVAVTEPGPGAAGVAPAQAIDGGRSDPGAMLGR